MDTTSLVRQYPINPGPLKVETIKILEGANYFSAGPIVLTRLDLGKYDEVFSNEIEGFYEKLESAIPSLYEHHCSEGKPGGFLFRVRKGTLMGHIIEHVAIELQTLAGMHASYGKTRSTLKQGVYNIIFRFIDDHAGIYAAKAAVNFINALLQNKDFKLKPIIDQLIKIREERLLGPSTQSIVDEANKREIPVFRLDQYNLIQLGTGKYQKRIRATITSETHFIAVENTFDKYLTTLSLRDSGLPVTETLKTSDINKGIDFLKNLKCKLVITPISRPKGEKVFIEVDTEEKLKKAFSFAAGSTKAPVLLQKQIDGNTYRVLVINNNMVSATKLSAAEVVGDGKKTILQLIEELNKNPLREAGDKGVLSLINIDDNLLNHLNLINKAPDSILEKGEKLRVKVSCNPNHGAITENVTKKIHPENRYLAERAARICGLNVAGVTIIAKDISRPITETGGIVLEVNAAPDFRMHLKPAKGASINPAIPMLDMLFPKQTQNRVPLISITGSAGKTVCAYILNYALEKEGHNTGLACSDGLFSAGKKVIHGNMTYPENVKALLGDPYIDHAILETSVEGILNNGLGYKFADVGIFLNVYDNHLNQGDISFIEDLAYAKSVVAEEVYDSGYSVLNADCPYIMESLSRLYSKAALFSKKPDQKTFSNHIVKGGLGVCIRDNKIFLHFRSGRWVIAEINELPLTYYGKTDIFIDSILAATAAMCAIGIKPGNISNYLKNFKPHANIIPGRMNLVNVNGGEVLIDSPNSQEAFDKLITFCKGKTKSIAAIVATDSKMSESEIKKLANNLNAFASRIIILAHKNETKTVPGNYYFEDEYINKLADNQRKLQSEMMSNEDNTISLELAKLLKATSGNIKIVEFDNNANIIDIIKTIPNDCYPLIITPSYYCSLKTQLLNQLKQ
ncbi:MAG: Mur ligase family protein [Bacteroidales bacterium]